jgi:hypothetical protein
MFIILSGKLPERCVKLFFRLKYFLSHFVYKIKFNF